MGAASHWNDFCQKAKKLIGKPFSFSQFASCLRLLDPNLFTDLSLLAKIAISVGFCRYEAIRKWLLSPSLHRFLQKNSTLWNEAPQEALNVYNALMAAFFTDALSLQVKAAPTVAIQPLDKADARFFERRLSFFIQTSVQFLDLQNQGKQLQKEGGTEENLSALE